jgi:hypothetical protein
MDLAARRGPRTLYAVDGSRDLDTARWVARRTGSRNFARYETVRVELSLPDLSDVTTWRWRFE